MMVEFFCQTCGATIEVTEDLLPLRCCRVYYPTLESLPTKAATEKLVVARCEKCGHRRRIPEGTDTPCPVCSPPAVFDGALLIEGPGTELKELLLSIGITPHVSCKCKAMMRKMNEWGVEGCKLHFAEIVTSMEDDAKKYRWKDRVTAAGRAVMKGLAFKVNWINPIPDLATEAIRRAEMPPPEST